MRRRDAVAFCSRPETQGTANFQNKWFFAFTTHLRDWRSGRLDEFREDDGRFDWLLDELGIETIWRKS